MNSNQLGPTLKESCLETVANIAQRKTGRRPSPATVWRWVRRGLRGGRVKLAAVCHSGRWQSTSAAFDAFIEAQTIAALDSMEEHQSIDANQKDAGLL